MRFPVRVRHRKAVATIYGRSKNYPFHRVAAYVRGKRRIVNYRTYSEAHANAERLVRDIAAGSEATALTAPRSRDALAALSRLEDFRRSTGRRVTLLGAVAEYVEAVGKLSRFTLAEAEKWFAVVPAAPTDVVSFVTTTEK